LALKVLFSKGKEATGKNWLKQILSQNNNLAARTPQGPTFFQAKMFTPDVVTKFFGLFEPALELIKHAPNRLYNCEETGITITQHKRRKSVPYLPFQRRSTSSRPGSAQVIISCPYKLNIQAWQEKKEAAQQKTQTNTGKNKESRAQKSEATNPQQVKRGSSRSKCFASSTRFGNSKRRLHFAPNDNSDMED
jgi:hypothetical protein